MWAAVMEHELVVKLAREWEHMWELELEQLLVAQWATESGRSLVQELVLVLADKLVKGWAHKLGEVMEHG
jgi:hypothetical protein